MELARFKQDVWGREVLLGVSWDLLWLVVAATFGLIILHAIVMLALRAQRRPDPSGRRLTRHAAADRWFHWTAALAFLVLLGTGVLPILGLKFPWLTLHWVAGLVLTAAVAFHIVRSLASKDRFAMNIGPTDLRELTDRNSLPGKYSLAQKSMHAAMTVLVLTTIITGLVLFALIDTPWWARSNFLSEAALGWMFLLHGAATLALLGLTALHLYFALRPEKQFYTRAMIKGWASEGELKANHDLARWRPAPHPQPAADGAPAAQRELSRPAAVAAEPP